MAINLYTLLKHLFFETDVNESLSIFHNVHNVTHRLSELLNYDEVHNILINTNDVVSLIKTYLPYLMMFCTAAMVIIIIGLVCTCIALIQQHLMYRRMSLFQYRAQINNAYDATRLSFG